VAAMLHWMNVMNASVELLVAMKIMVEIVLVLAKALLMSTTVEFVLQEQLANAPTRGKIVKETAMALPSLTTVVNAWAVSLALSPDSWKIVLAHVTARLS
jgi:hypothetical protein